MNREELADRLWAILYPKRCILCDTVVAYEEFCCSACHCDAAEPIQVEMPLAGAVAAAYYEGNIERIIRAMKQEKMYWEHGFFASELARAVTRYWPDTRWDWIVPVPLSADRLKKRKFNQAQRLADRLNIHLQSTIRTDVLLRKDSSLTQHDLSREERKKNAAASFGLFSAAAISGTVLLVDDVCTTGSTLAACAHLLLQAGADKVYAATAAQTPLPGAAPPHPPADQGEQVFILR